MLAHPTSRSEMKGKLILTASLKQKRTFFALVNSLGYDKIEAKKRAKAKFNAESFNDITEPQLSILIDMLVEECKKKGISLERLKSLDNDVEL